MTKNLVFALFGIGILVSFTMLFLKERDREWMRFQKEFRRMGKEMIQEQISNTTDEGERKKLVQALEEIGESGEEIKQVYLKDLEVMDRCESCHLGISDERWSEAPQPFASHTQPVLALHPSYKFGCTVCHQGQGLATTTQGGHGYEKNWKDPLLPLEYIEASCNQCHADLTFRAAPIAVRGNYLIRRLGCLGCHQADSPNYRPGEKIGPALDPIGSKVDPEWLLRFLEDPKSYSAETRMPNFQFSDDEVLQVRGYLLSLDQEVTEADRRRIQGVGTMSPSTTEPNRGKTLVKDLSCTTCHRIEGVAEDGFFRSDKIGPELSRVGSKVKTAWLQEFLKKPTLLQPGSKMPNYRLGNRETVALTAYLKSLGWDTNGLPGRKAKTSAQGAKISVDPETEPIESGKRLVIKYNCIGCHDIKGMEKGERGPAWDGIGGRPLRKFDFGDNPDNVKKTKFAWIKAKVVKPRSFGDSLKMPVLDIPEEDATAITTALLGLTGKTIPGSYRVKAEGRKSPSVRVPLKGLAGSLWQELKCHQCHSVGGVGGNVGPELSFEGSRVRREWVAGYLKRPSLIRPISADRMPDLGLKESEAAILADFMELSLVDSNLPQALPGEPESTGKLTRRGKKLFTRKYGCIGCHIIGKKGGLIGPDVTDLGKRLKGDWLYAYLKNPQSAIPGAMMPNFGLSDGDARALTVYLLSLGTKKP